MSRSDADAATTCPHHIIHPGWCEMVQPALQLLISRAGAAPCVPLHCAVCSLVATEVPYSVYSLPFIT